MSEFVYLKSTKDISMLHRLGSGSYVYSILVDEFTSSYINEILD